MKIQVTAKPRCKVEGVEKISETEFLVRVNTPPIEGRANQRIIELLSLYFKIPKSKVKLLKGEKGKKKVFEIVQD